MKIDRPLVGPDYLTASALFTVRNYKPTKDNIELIRQVLVQNAEILKMNARMMDVLTAYVVKVKP